MIRNSGNKKDIKESEEKARRQDCESDEIRKSLKLREKNNRRALVVAQHSAVNVDARALSLLEKKS